MVSQLIVTPSETPLQGSVPLPSDQDVALARLAIGVLSRGTTSVAFRGMQRTLRAFVDLCARIGITVTCEADVVRVQGRGLFGITPPTEILDARGDAELGALAVALLVSRPQESEILVDEVVAEALAVALAEAHPIERHPVAGEPGVRLVLGAGSEPRSPGLHVATSGVFPWVKQAILLAGFRAKEPTVIEERLASRDHLERAMTRARLPLQAEGTALVLHPPRDDDALAPQTYELIGSAHLAASVAAAAAMIPGSRLTLREVSTNPTSSDWLGVVKLFGHRVGMTPRGDRQGEPFGDLFVEATAGNFANLGGEVAVRLGDCVVPLLALAARASGTSTFSDLVARSRGGDLRIFGRAVGLLTSAGVKTRFDDGLLAIEGNGGMPFEPLQVTTGGDSRLAILATVLALSAKSPSIIDDVDCLGHDFPRWVGTLRALGAKLEVRTSD